MTRTELFALIAVALIAAGGTLLLGLALYLSPNGGSQTQAPGPVGYTASCAMCVPVSP